MNYSSDLAKSFGDLDLSKSQFNELSISLTYSLNIKSIVAGTPATNNEIYSTTFFKISNLKCLNCAADMCYYKSRETEKAKILIKCNLCGISAAPNAEGFLLCRNCDFSLCHKCRVCPNGHYLKKIYEFNLQNLPNFIQKNFTNSLGEMKCHLCGTNCIDKEKSIVKRNNFYVCWTCVYLICDKCMLRTKGINL